MSDHIGTITRRIVTSTIRGWNYGRSFASPGTAIITIVGCTGRPAASLRLSEATYGDRWPFTVGEVTIRCVADAPRYYVVFDANGMTYALNGSARGPGRWRDSDDVRKVDPATRAQPDIFDRPFVDFEHADFIQPGLQLCEQQR